MEIIKSLADFMFPPYTSFPVFYNRFVNKIKVCARVFVCVNGKEKEAERKIFLYRNNISILLSFPAADCFWSLQWNAISMFYCPPSGDSKIIIFFPFHLDMQIAKHESGFHLEILLLDYGMVFWGLHDHIKWWNDGKAAGIINMRCGYLPKIRKCKNLVMSAKVDTERVLKLY